MNFTERNTLEYEVELLNSFFEKYDGHGRTITMSEAQDDDGVVSLGYTFITAKDHPGRTECIEALCNLYENTIYWTIDDMPLMKEAFTEEEFIRELSHMTSDELLSVADELDAQYRYEEKAEEIIDAFCEREYHENANFSDPRRIPIGFTIFNEGEPNEKQVATFVDLDFFKIWTEVNGEPRIEWRCEDADSFIEELKHLDYHELVEQVGQEEE